MVGDYAYLLVDHATEEVIGFQIEDVATQAIDEHPIVLDAPSIAELRGISPTEVKRVRRQRALGEAPNLGPSVDGTKGQERRKREVIEGFLRDRSLCGTSTGNA